MSDAKIDKIEKIDEAIETAQSKAEPQNRVAPSGEHFNSLMVDERTTLTQRGGKSSLMDTVRDSSHTGPTSGSGRATPDALIVQTQEAIQRIEEIKHSLESPNVKLKSSAQQLLHNKLQHIDDSLRIALTKVGADDLTPPSITGEKPARVNPIERFLGFLTDGQWQLEHIGDELRVMGNNGKEMSPVNMLAVQVKVTQIQQELELFSNLLGKALESIKTVMNIQV